MGRYICNKHKEVNIAKANKVCLMKRCPELLVKTKINNKRVTMPVVMMSLREVDVTCEGV